MTQFFSYDSGRLNYVYPYLISITNEGSGLLLFHLTPILIKNKNYKEETQASSRKSFFVLSKFFVSTVELMLLHQTPQVRKKNS